MLLLVEGSLSRDGSKKTKLQRKRSLKNLGSRVRMFPGAAAGTTASPNWSAYEGNEDLISLSGLSTFTEHVCACVIQGVSAQVRTQCVRELYRSF